MVELGPRTVDTSVFVVTAPLQVDIARIETHFERELISGL